MINPKKDTKIKQRLKEFNQKFMPYGMLMVLTQRQEGSKWYVELQNSRLDTLIAISNNNSHGYDIQFNAADLTTENPCGQMTIFFNNGTFILDQVKLLEKSTREAA